MPSQPWHPWYDIWTSGCGSNDRERKKKNQKNERPPNMQETPDNSKIAISWWCGLTAAANSEQLMKNRICWQHEINTQLYWCGIWNTHLHHWCATMSIDKIGATEIKSDPKISFTAIKTTIIVWISVHKRNKIWHFTQKVSVSYKHVRTIIHIQYIYINHTQNYKTNVCARMIIPTKYKSFYAKSVCVIVFSQAFHKTGFRKEHCPIKRRSTLL